MLYRGQGRTAAPGHRPHPAVCSDDREDGEGYRGERPLIFCYVLIPYSPITSWSPLLSPGSDWQFAGRGEHSRAPSRGSDSAGAGERAGWWVAIITRLKCSYCWLLSECLSEPKSILLSYFVILSNYMSYHSWISTTSYLKSRSYQITMIIIH